MGKPRVRSSRGVGGVACVQARSFTGLMWGLGHWHARDRGLQMLLMRLLGRGEASRWLQADEKSWEIDVFFRRAGWHLGLEGEAARLSPAARDACEAYADGVNAWIRRRRWRALPWELRLLGYRPDPWTVADSILILRMTGYLTLAQSQAELERLLLEMVQAGVGRGRLEELFPGLLEGLDEEAVRKLQLRTRLVPEAVAWQAGLPRLLASNNWVVSGARTASGHALLANDPHLETNRLPNVWYEALLQTPARWIMGATMPGIPGVLLGRTEDVAWGATYSFMDAVDSWIEHCRGGAVRRGEAWEPVRVRAEQIERKGKAARTVYVHETSHGVLEHDPPDDGLVLATRWASAQAGATSLEQVVALWGAQGIEDALASLGRVEVAFNWVAADRAGRVGYQMSGLLPRRRAGVSGLVPLAGWDARNAWQGFVPPAELPRQLDPPEGFFVTANDDLNRHGQARAINASMGPWRASRIREVLAAETKVTTEQACTLHYDVLSLHARRFLEVLRPLLPAEARADLLRRWDGCYTLDSAAPSLFEDFYRELRREVFGPGLGPDVFAHLDGETGTFVDFYDVFDQVLLAEQSAWFGGESRETLWRRALGRALAAPSQAWRERQQLVLRHLLFGGRLPRLFGFDRGPVALPGGRATVHQAQIYRSGGRDTSFVGSFRMVTDLGTSELWTNLAGGPSDRRFSRWYCNGLEDWQAGRYKCLRPGPSER